MVLHRSSISASGVLLFTVTLLLIVPSESRSNVSTVDTAVQNSTDVEAVDSALVGTAKRNVQDEFNSTDHDFSLNAIKVNTSTLQSLPQAGAAFKLVLQWPYSLCNPNERHCKQLDVTHAFLVHGLWPDPTPNPCFGVPFSKRTIKNSPLKDKLKKWWPNVLGRDDPTYIYSDNEWFWSHEWESHGACSGYKQFDYFTIGADYARGIKLRFNLEYEIRRRGYTSINQGQLLHLLEKIFSVKRLA